MSPKRLQKKISRLKNNSGQQVYKLSKFFDRRCIQQTVSQLIVAVEQNFSTLCSRLPRSDNIVTLIEQMEQREMSNERRSNHALAMIVGMFLLRSEQFYKAIKLSGSKTIAHRLLDSVRYRRIRKDDILEEFNSDFVFILDGEMTIVGDKPKTFRPQDIAAKCPQTQGLLFCSKPGIVLLVPSLVLMSTLEQAQNEEARRQMEFISKSLFLGVGGSTLARLHKKFLREEKPRLSYVFRQDQQQTHAYLVMAGIVLVEKLILGKNWGLLTMEKGAFFSREGLGEGRRQSYGVKCLTEVKLLAIEAKELHKFCQEISQLRGSVQLLSCSRSSNISSKLQFISRLNRQLQQDTKGELTLKCKTPRSISRGIGKQPLLRSQNAIEPNQLLVDEALYHDLVGEHEVIRDFIESKALVFKIIASRKPDCGNDQKKFIASLKFKTRSQQKKQKFNRYLTLKRASDNVKGTGIRFGNEQSYVKILSIFQQEIAQNLEYVVIPPSKRPTSPHSTAAFTPHNTDRLKMRSAESLPFALTEIKSFPSTRENTSRQTTSTVKRRITSTKHSQFRNLERATTKQDQPAFHFTTEVTNSLKNKVALHLDLPDRPQ